MLREGGAWWVVRVKKPYEGRDPYIFVSYSHKDREIVLPIIDELQREGYRVWYDAGVEAGMQWNAHIAEHVFSCRCFISMLTSASVASKHCEGETHFAYENNKDMLFVQLEDVELTLAMQMEYGLFQRLVRDRFSTNEEFLGELLGLGMFAPCLDEGIVRENKILREAGATLADSRASEAALWYAYGQVSALPGSDPNVEKLALEIGERIRRLSDAREQSERDQAKRVDSKQGDALRLEASKSAPDTIAVESTKDKSNPRVFISYSWSSDEYQQDVVRLADRLLRDGVDVVIDIWDLRPGHDKYRFMERCVTDRTIDKVLILCDKAYADKADGRMSGVGDETTVISSEVYGRSEQRKFIPVVMERDEGGHPFLPAYLQSRVYIDLSDANHEKHYEDLLYSISDMSKWDKPDLGSFQLWAHYTEGAGETERDVGAAQQDAANGALSAVSVSTDLTANESRGVIPGFDVPVRAGIAAYSWAELKSLADEIAAASDTEWLGIAKTCHLVDANGELQGDTKPLKLTDGTECSIRIAGFRHDEKVSGGKAGITFEFADLPATHRMNAEWANRGGWKNCEMRGWLRDEFFFLLPDDVRANILEVIKQTNNKGKVDAEGDTGVVSSTRDKLWLLSFSEVYGDKLTYTTKGFEGKPVYSLDTYNAEGTQYKLYADQKVSTGHHSFCVKEGAYSWWWLRSPRANGSVSFLGVYPDGDWNRYDANLELGVSPVFCF